MNEGVKGLTAADRLRKRHCMRAMRGVFFDALSAAIAQGWTEAEAAFFIAENADEYIIKLCRAPPRAAAADLPDLD